MDALQHHYTLVDLGASQSSVPMNQNQILFRFDGLLLGHLAKLWVGIRPVYRQVILDPPLLQIHVLASYTFALGTLMFTLFILTFYQHYLLCYLL